MLNIEIAEIENGIVYDVHFESSLKGQDVVGDSQVTVTPHCIRIEEFIKHDDSRIQERVSRVIEGVHGTLLRDVESNGLHHLHLLTYSLQRAEEETTKRFNRYFDAPESFIMKEGK